MYMSVITMLFEPDNVFFRKFDIINPTHNGYDFVWTNEGSLPSISAPATFQCLTPKGFIAAGKKFEVYMIVHMSYA